MSRGGLICWLIAYLSLLSLTTALPQRSANTTTIFNLTDLTGKPRTFETRVGNGLKFLESYLETAYPILTIKASPVSGGEALIADDFVQIAIAVVDEDSLLIYGTDNYQNSVGAWNGPNVVSLLENGAPGQRWSWGDKRIPLEEAAAYLWKVGYREPWTAVMYAKPSSDPETGSWCREVFYFFRWRTGVVAVGSMTGRVVGKPNGGLAAAAAAFWGADHRDRGFFNLTEI